MCDKFKRQEELRLLESDEFWNTVNIKPEFISLVQSGILNDYNSVFVTIGTDDNLDKKKQFLLDNLLPLAAVEESNLNEEKQNVKNFIMTASYIGLYEGQKKSEVNMRDGIQIDDNYDNLRDTNARLKIVLTNGLETFYNRLEGNNLQPDNLDNLYYVNDLEQFAEILAFNTDERL